MPDNNPPGYQRPTVRNRRKPDTGLNFRATRNREKGEKIPCDGAASMSDEEFRAQMFSTIPSMEDLVARNRRKML